MTTISVVIPVKDDAFLLRECLESLSRQTRPPDEIIVVDNGSSDNSAEVAHRFGATVITEDRPGVTAASSAGFDRARGNIIARCDADSRLPQTWLAHIEHTLARHPDAVAVTGPGRFIGMPRACDALLSLAYLGPYFATMRLLLGHHALFGSNCAIRRETWRAISAAVPRDDPCLHDDMDLSCRLPRHARVIYDRTLVVGISPRPLRSPGAILHRLRRAVHTYAAYARERRSGSSMPISRPATSAAVRSPSPPDDPGLSAAAHISPELETTGPSPLGLPH